MTANKVKQVYIEYYALLREERGLSSEIVETSADSLKQLYEQLRGKHNFRLSCDQLRVAVNDRLQNWDSELKNDDKVVIIPPVAGG